MHADKFFLSRASRYHEMLSRAHDRNSYFSAKAIQSVRSPRRDTQTLHVPSRAPYTLDCRVSDMLRKKFTSYIFFFFRGHISTIIHTYIHIAQY